MLGLSRSQVAKRLGKSVATVRRLEGHVLFPVRDRRGIYRFEQWEVERLIGNPERATRWARSRWLVRALSERRVHQSSPAGSLRRSDLTQVMTSVRELVDRICDIEPSSLRRTGVDRNLLSVLVEAVDLLERGLQR